MRGKDVVKFLNDFKIDGHKLAHCLGITKPAVDHWVTERRSVPPTVVKLLKMFRKDPTLFVLFETL